MSCKSLPKNSCVEPCTWVRKSAKRMAHCKRRRRTCKDRLKTDCNNPCSWVKRTARAKAYCGHRDRVRKRDEYVVRIQANVAEYDKTKDDYEQVDSSALTGACKRMLKAHLRSELIFMARNKLITMTKPPVMSSCLFLSKMEVVFRVTSNESVQSIRDSLEVLGEKSINSKHFDCGKRDIFIDGFSKVEVIPMLS